MKLLKVQSQDWSVIHVALNDPRVNSEQLPSAGPRTRSLIETSSCQEEKVAQAVRLPVEINPGLLLKPTATTGCCAY